MATEKKDAPSEGEVDVLCSQCWPGQLLADSARGPASMVMDPSTSSSSGGEAAGEGADEDFARHEDGEEIIDGQLLG